MDRHLADQLIIFAALARGTSEFLIPQLTDHVHTNIWLVDTILGAEPKSRDSISAFREWAMSHRPRVQVQRNARFRPVAEHNNIKIIISIDILSMIII